MDLNPTLPYLLLEVRLMFSMLATIPAQAKFSCLFCEFIVFVLYLAASINQGYNPQSESNFFSLLCTFIHSRYKQRVVEIQSNCSHTVENVVLTKSDNHNVDNITKTHDNPVSVSRVSHYLIRKIVKN